MRKNDILEREKLQEELKNLKRPVWKKFSTYLSIIPIVIAIITLGVIWNSKALEIYNANLTAEIQKNDSIIKRNESDITELSNLKAILSDSIARANITITNQNLAKKYYDSVFNVMDYSRDSNKKLIAGMANNVTALRGQNAILIDSLNNLRNQNDQVFVPVNNNSSLQALLNANSQSIKIGSPTMNGFLNGNYTTDSNGNLILNNPPLSTGILNSASFDWRKLQTPTNNTNTLVLFPTLDSAVNYYYNQHRADTIRFIGN